MKKRTLRQLVENTERKDIYLKDRETYMRFFRQAREEGFHFGDLPFEKWSAKGRIVVIHSDGEMGHVPYFHYHILQYPEKIEIVDFKKYADGEENYLYGRKD